MCELWSMLDHSQDRKIHFTLGETIMYDAKGKWIHEDNYTEEQAMFDRVLDSIEAKMELDCPDSYQVRGIKEEDEEK